MEAAQTKTNTATSVVYPIVGALVAAEKELGPHRPWKALDEVQHQFIELAFAPGRDEVSDMPELESIASQDIATVNRFLRDRGFVIELKPTGAAGEIGIASVLKLMLEWLEKGIETGVRLQNTDRMFPAVLLKKGIEFLELPDHFEPIVRIETVSGDVVYLTMTDEAVAEEELNGFALRIMSGTKPSLQQYPGVIFPMIDLDLQPDLGWLIGLSTFGRDGRIAVITQAVQQTKFCMDHVGAKVESAVAMMISRGISLDAPKPHTIDRPFLAVVARPFLTQPIFVGYLGTDCWKKPVR